MLEVLIICIFVIGLLVVLSGDENKRKFGQDLYSFVPELNSKIGKRIVIDEILFFKLKKSSNLFKEQKLITKSKSNKRLNRIKSVHCSILTPKKNSKEVCMFLIIEFRYKSSSKLYFNELKEILNKNKGVFALRKSNIVILIYSNYFRLFTYNVTINIYHKFFCEELFLDSISRESIKNDEK